MALLPVKIRLRSDTAAAWLAANPVLSQGEAGFERDTGVLKIGDGSAAFNSLSPFLNLAAMGDEFQPAHANLTDLSALVLTAAGKALLDDADATAQRATLGLIADPDQINTLGAAAKLILNWDHIDGSGFYYGSGADNAPAAGVTYNAVAFQSTAIGAGAGRISVIAMRHSQDEVWFRRKNTTWEPWVQLYPFPVAPGNFQSAEQAITLDGNLTIPHGMGAIPRAVRASYICKTAEGSHAVGDEILPNWFANGTGGNTTGNLSWNGSSIFVTFPNVLRQNERGAAVTFNLTPANWRLIVRADP